MISSFSKYLALRNKFPVKINRWDVFALVLVLGTFMALTSAAKQMALPFHIGEPIAISLNPSMLPSYALQTVLRMFIALFFSLLFTFIFATWAAKSPRAEKIIIPIIDVLQSVPVLAFLSLTITGFIALFPNSLLGPECATVFLIFTSQAWNMALSFYQSLKTLPAEFREVGDMFHLSSWQKFWRMDVPFAMPGLIWNMMMSMSASWFSLVASEAITVGDQRINLPGIGSYIATAILHADIRGVCYAIVTMFIVISVYNQLIFRPLIKWSEKFDIQLDTYEKSSSPWLIRLLQRTYLMKHIGNAFATFSESLINFRFFKKKKIHSDHEAHHQHTSLFDTLWTVLICLLLIGAIFSMVRFLIHSVGLHEIGHVFLLGCFTCARVIAVIILSSLIWVPIGVWIGLRPRVTAVVQPVAQFLAAFPANLLFPMVIIFIVKYSLNVEIWVTPLMMLGAQWYVLFNVIAGTSAIPKELRQVAENFGLSGKLWWVRLILPAIFPYYITGAITAVGGAWNASIVAEVVTWGDTTLRATGLGAYIVEHTGNFPYISLGVCVMCLFVLTLNRLIWRPLYAVAQEHYQI